MIRRYDFNPYVGFGSAHMSVEDDGSYIYFTDYQDLLREGAFKDAVIEAGRAVKTYEGHGEEGDCTVGVENLEDAIRELDAVSGTHDDEKGHATNE